MPAATDPRFESVYRTHSHDVLAYCQRRVSRDEAMDAASQVFEVVLRRIDDVPSGDDTLPWLYVTAKNVLRNRARSRRRRQRLNARVSVNTEGSAPGPEPQIVRNEEHQALLDALNRLPQKDQEILRLIEWEGLSRVEVAEMYFVSRAAVDQRISRAYRRMARTLGVPRRMTRTAPVPTEERGDV